MVDFSIYAESCYTIRKKKKWHSSNQKMTWAYLHFSPNFLMILIVTNYSAQNGWWLEILFSAIQ